MKAWFIVLLVLTLSFLWATLPAHANTEVGVFIASKHPGDKEYNESNPGIYGIHAGYTAGVFKNSYYDTTYMIGITSDVYKNTTIGYGLVHGYGWEGGYADADKYGVKTLLYILPTVSYAADGFKINIHYIGSGAALSISKVFH